MKAVVLIASLLTGFLALGASASDCVNVKTWNEFSAAVKEKDSVTFCPFSIWKPEKERLLVESDKTLICSEAKRCAIRGAGNHIRVRGGSAKLTLDGFSLRGASKSALFVTNSSPKTHVIRRCVFHNNYGERGGAIRTGSRTSLSIFSTRFDGNEAKIGGGIRHGGGFLYMKDSIFKDNQALRGAGIFLSASTQMEFEKTKFLGNVATERSSGAISAGSINSFATISDVTASNNGTCDGIYSRSQKQCHEFKNRSSGTGGGTPSCASESRSCDAGCCAELQCSDSSKTCEKENTSTTPEESSYAYSGSGCRLKGPSPTASNTIMKFLALGDTPYDDEVRKPPFEGKEYKCLRDRILPGVQQLAQSADFIAHVGDIKKGGSGFSNYCNRQVFGSRRDLFAKMEPELDFLIVVGDNEWNECRGYNKDPRVGDSIKNLWRQNFVKGKFADFDRVLPYGGSVHLERQSSFPENFFFYYGTQAIAFFGITEPMNEDRYDPINADWISFKLKHKSPKAVVVFAHSKLSREVLSVLPEVPTLHVTGNTHAYCMQRSGQKPFLLELTVEAFEASPLLVSIVKDSSDHHFFHVEKTPYGC